MRDKAFRMIIEVFFIFGLPALGGYWLGRMLDNSFETGKTITIVVMVVAFISSWTLVIMKYRKLDRALTKLDQLRREAQIK